MKKQTAQLEQYEQVLSWNVIDKETFRRRTRNVFAQVAKSLTNTLGPNGATTVLEQFGEMHVTKDGWSVLKRIAFNDPVEQSILNLLTQISAQVVNKVGDGSTSSIVAANEILKEIENNQSLKQMRPKDIVDKLKELSMVIREQVLARSNKIDRSDSFEDIYRLTKISTNGEEKVARIIQKIYQETQNPSIDIRDSKSVNTYEEIITGFQTAITLTDPIFATHDDGMCKVEQPLYLMFDHKVDMEQYNEFIYPAMDYAVKEDRRLVIVAPHYDKQFLQVIGAQITASIQKGNMPIGIFTNVSLFNNAATNEYNDLATLLGATIIREYTSRDRFTARMEKEEELSNAKDGEVVEPLAPFDIVPNLGKSRYIEINMKNALCEGFYNRNETMYKIAFDHATSQLEDALWSSKDMNIVDANIYELKKRVAKLQCKMGVIYVGAQSRLERRANKDLVEDAVKAAESAYQYGYNIGGNLIIPIVIEELLADEKLTNPTDIEFFKSISTAFKKVFECVLRNKYDNGGDDESLIESTVATCIAEEKCYDLITDKYTTDVINPTFTDVEILSAATSIVALVVSSNQYVSIAVDQDVPE